MNGDERDYASDRQDLRARKPGSNGSGFELQAFKPSSPIHGAPFRSTVIHHRAVRVDHRADGITGQIDTQPLPVCQGMNPLAT
jgi:hypothetical protein